MLIMNIYAQKKPPAHPGVILAEKFIEPMHISRYELTKTLGWSYDKLQKLINGESRITVDKAMQLAEALDVAPDLWIFWQKKWDAWHPTRPA